MENKLFGKFKVKEKIRHRFWERKKFWQILCVGDIKLFYKNEKKEEGVIPINELERYGFSIWKEPKLKFDLSRDYFWGELNCICLFKKFSTDKFFLIEKNEISGIIIVSGNWIKTRYEPVKDQPLKDWGIE